MEHARVYLAGQKHLLHEAENQTLLGGCYDMALYHLMSLLTEPKSISACVMMCVAVHTKGASTAHGSGGLPSAHSKAVTPAVAWRARRARRGKAGQTALDGKSGTRYVSIDERPRSGCPRAQAYPPCTLPIEECAG